MSAMFPLSDIFVICTKQKSVSVLLNIIKRCRAARKKFSHSVQCQWYIVAGIIPTFAYFILRVPFSYCFVVYSNYSLKQFFFMGKYWWAINNPVHETTIAFYNWDLNWIFWMFKNSKCGSLKLEMLTEQWQPDSKHDMNFEHITVLIN